jgi:alpha-L-rhamnosidase
MKQFYPECVWLTLATMLTFSAAAQGISPTHLQCEAKSNPLGLTETSPRLSWQDMTTLPGSRGQYQTAYQIQVASSSQLLTGNVGDLWDTGQVATNQTSQIPYGGSTLATDQACYWHVRVWDGAGQPSAWSAPAYWSMGLLLTNTTVALAQITWGATGTFTGDSVLSLAGAVSNEVYGVDFGGSGAQTTANGYKFSDYATSGNMSIAGSPPSFGGYMTGGVTTGDTALDSILTHGLYGSTANTGTLNNLTVGQAYTVLALLADTRGALAGGSTFTVTDGVTTSPSQQYAFANGSPSVGGYILGTFTATATTQSYTVENGDNTQFNAVLLITNTAPTTAYTNYVTQSKWTGQWIGRDDAPSYSNTNDGKTYLAATQVRKDFKLSQLPVRAILYVTSLGLVEPHLNGAKVGTDYFIPGWTDYSQRVYYRTYDVTSLLQQGSNTLGAILGDGWFRGNISILGQNYYGTTTRLCAELHMFYAGGTNQVIASDSSWKAGFGPIRQSDIQSGEVYNAQLETRGWDSPGYSNASWTLVTTGATVIPLIVAAPAEPVCTNQQIVPTAITQPQSGVYVVNFGQNFAGWARLTLSNQPAGRTIVMHFGEWLKPDGTLFRDNLRSAAATDTYICKGGVETWEPRFTYHGFQYLQVQGLTQAPTTNTFMGVVVHSGLSEAGSFQCSNDLINHIYSNMLWTVRANAFDIPTDCDQRDERMGWCDGTEVMRTGMFLAQGESFFSKWYQDMVDGKLDATTFPQMAPTPHKSFGFASGWSDCGVLVPYWLYQTYGDTRVASRFYADMQSHLQHYAATAVNYIGQSGSYGDWLAVDNSTPGNLVSTAFYAGCASEMAEMAQTLGKTADATAYQQLFTNICAAFQANFVASDGTVGSGSESGYVLALYFNLLTPAQRTLAAAKLVAAVQAQNGHVSTGMVTTHWLMPALTSIGRSDLAYQMLAKTDYPSWGFWINLGATTMWEQWNSVNADGTINTGCYNYPMDSLNHANFGTCVEWFYRGILGIDRLQPGFSKILINPQPGGALTSAQGYYDSIQGRIASAWQLTNNVLTLNITIPANTTAQINVPTTNATAITENGLAAASSPGVTYVGVSNSIVAGVSTNTYAIYIVGSGNYVFASPFSIPATPVPPVPPTITATNQTGSGSGTFYPGWTVVTNGSLIAGQSPSMAAGNFSEEVPGRSVNFLTTGNNLGITLINGTFGTTCSTNYVTCGNGTGPDGSSAGSTIIYSLSGSTNGYNLTNIMVYGGWADNGRDQQAYTVYYSTVTAPTNFIPLTVVNYNPSIGSGIQSATRVMLTSSDGVLATNAVAVKFDFTSPASEAGYCGYAGISVFGMPGIAPAVPAALNAALLTPNRFVMNVGSLVVGRNAMLQSTSNLASGVWITETNFVATQSAAAFTNFTTNFAQQFYRVVGY